MMLDNRTIVGFKKMKLDNDHNQITTPDDCWGISHVPPVNSNHCRSAIVVDDFKHLLILAGHHLPHHLICIPHGIY